MRTAAPEYIKARRMADPGWVRRHKRSLGRNKRYRACVRANHELRAELAKMRKQAEKTHASSATRIARHPLRALSRSKKLLRFFVELLQRFKEFLGLAPRMFARRQATS
jgi:hypothetical protein